ncbi:MAG TPA: hypothetical protein VMD78_10310 [Candidatus Baltobacteraceae bacterium]|nr:hypothetical protein [Candidatus Baltobacteraceae bacterium]
MNSIHKISACASWLAASAFALLLGASCPIIARAQAQTPPPGAPGAMRPHGQMGMHPQAAPQVPASTKVETAKTTEKGEQFFIIASLDQQKAEILLKRPDEVTELLNTTPKTQYLDENGKPLKLSDLRAGDTVWVTLSGGANPTAIRVRKGQMTVADLHRYFLDYPEIK